MSNHSFPLLTFCPDIGPQWLSRVINGVVVTFMVLFGVFGSAYSILHLSQNKAMRHTRFVVHLKTLCVWDIAMLVCAEGSYAFIELIFGTKPWYGLQTYLYLIFYPLGYVAMTGSIWMVVAISCERFLAVFRPLRHHFRTVASVKLVCSLVGVCSLVVNLPVFAELDLRWCIGRDDLRTYPMISPSAIRDNPAYFLAFRVILFPLFTSVVPFLAVLALSIATLYARWKAIQQRDQYMLTVSRLVQPAHKQILNDSHTTILLSAVIVKFLICYTGSAVLSVLEFIDKDSITATMVSISDIGVVLHSASNWIILCYWRHRSGVPQSLASHKSALVTLSKGRIRRLKYLWSLHDPNEVGTELLLAMLIAKPQIADQLHLFDVRCDLDSDRSRPKLPPSERTLRDRGAESSLSLINLYRGAPRITQLGQHIGRFLTTVLMALDFDDRTLMEATVQATIGGVGERMHAKRVTLKNTDWLLAKRFLVAKMTDSVECVEYVRERDRLLVRHFASLIINDIKNEFMRHSAPSETVCTHI